MSKFPVWKWLEVSEEDFDKIRGKGKCVKCGKNTDISRSVSNRFPAYLHNFLADNLCRGHKIAYHRWRNKKEREDRDKERRNKVNTMIDVCRSKKFVSKRK